MTGLSADELAAFLQEMLKSFKCFLVAQQLQSLPAHTMSMLFVEWMQQTSNICDNKDDPKRSWDMLERL